MLQRTRKGGSLSLLLATVLLATVLGVLAQTSGARSSEVDDLSALLNRYFALASERDMSRLGPLWAHDSGVVLVFPSDKQAAVGWEAVQKSYQARFDSVSDWKLSAKEAPHIQIHPGNAVTTTPVLIQATAKSGAAISYTLLFTQVFERRDNQWLLVASHGSKVPD
jgi:ketosteroid isomerase-like protein